MTSPIHSLLPRRVPCALLAAAVLLVIPPRAVAAGSPRSIDLSPPDCGSMPPLASGTSSVLVLPAGGVTQPLPGVTCVAACSLYITNPPYYSSARLIVTHWDPLGLAPDPTTVALRTRNFTPSSIVYARTRANFTPPVVTEALPHVADANSTPIAIDWKVTDPYNGQTIYYDADASAGLPPALLYPPNGTRAPLAGASPTLDFSVCDGGTATVNLRVAQAVMRCDALQPKTTLEWAQRFRVPEAVALGWVELALQLDPDNIYAGPTGRVAILDAEGQSAPPSDLSASIVEAALVQSGIATPFWMNHFDFPKTVTLLPGHDYWLTFRGAHYYMPYTRVSGGTESADFTAGIGPLFSRTELTNPWIGMPGNALDFRLISEAVTVTGVNAPAARGGAFALRVAPNPTGGAARVTWSNAAGTVHLEVLDARGRRVAEAASDGDRWNWSGRDAAGRPLPAGLYFVRARDLERRTAVERLVLVR